VDDRPGRLGEAPEQLGGPAGAAAERVIEADDDLARAEKSQETSRT
jgi:hypothetical protein